MPSTPIFIGIVVIVIAIFFGFWKNGGHTFKVPKIQQSASAAKEISAHAKSLAKEFMSAMVDGNWELLRSIGNLTTGENITVEVLYSNETNVPLIRSSVIIRAPPKTVAAYYKAAPSQAASIARISEWNKRSSGFNLALINGIDKVQEIDGSNTILVKQYANAYGAFALLFWSTRIFHQAQTWITQDRLMRVKEVSVSQKFSFDIPAETSIFASFSVEYSDESVWGPISEGETLALKDTLYWFIPVAGDQGTRVVSVSRQELGELVPR